VIVELLVVPDCPNGAAAAALVRAALTDVGLPGVEVRTTVIDSQHEAERRRFAGSPTILIDGDDPFVDTGLAPALACRVYRSTGGPSGVPDLDTLRQALARAAHNSVVSGIYLDHSS
jgi:hypothetical protein